MSGLPREVLKWMQSLDLSYSVRNVRRDFCNGFLVAEVFARYFADQLALHSFDNGSAMARRRDNWAQLSSFFTAHDIAISQEEITEVMACKRHAAVKLVCKVYTILTGRDVRLHLPDDLDVGEGGDAEDEVDRDGHGVAGTKAHDPHAAKAVASEYVPAFARPTASHLVKQRHKEPDMFDAQDVETIHRVAEQTLAEHEAALREERKHDRERFGTGVQAAPVARVPTRKVREAEEDAPQVQFTKEVNIKKVDDRKLRKQRAAAAGLTAGDGHADDAHGRPSLSPRSGTSPSGRPGSASGGFDRHVALRPVIQILNECVEEHVVLEADVGAGGASPSNGEAKKHDAFRVLLTRLGSTDDAVVADVFHMARAEHAHVLADAGLNSPKEFWTLTSLCLEALLAVPEGSAAAAAIVELLVVVGHCMVETETSVPWQLFADFALTKLYIPIKRHPGKRHDLMEIIFAFSDPDNRAAVLQRLCEGLEGRDDVILDCLAALVNYETRFSHASQELYLEYVDMALDADAPVLIAAGISILAVLCVHDEGCVLSRLDAALAHAASDSPVVLGQVVRLVCSLLVQIELDHALAPQLYSTVERLHRDNVAVMLDAEASIRALSAAMKFHPALRTHFTRMMLRVPDVRGRLLDPASPDALPKEWHALSVAKAVVDHIHYANIDNLQPGHVDLLAAAITPLRHFPEDELSEWSHAFLDLRDFLLVELLDADLCDAVVLVLRKFLYDNDLQQVALSIMYVDPGPEQQAQAAPPLFGILKLLYGPAGNPKSRKTLYKLLDELVTRDEGVFLPLLYNLLRNFAGLHPGKFEESDYLQKLMDKLQQAE